MDITPNDAGDPAFPPYIVNPFPAAGKKFTWSTDDWDPALRFWSLPFDRHLNEWLKTVDNPHKPSILAAREFAHELWAWEGGKEGDVLIKWLKDRHWLQDDDLTWNQANDNGRSFIVSEIEALRQYMEDDRDRYLAEIDAQADGLPGYILAFIGASQERHPWTVELLNCAMAISNVAYMHWKDVFKRVRPSVLCPGLNPPFGPPAHPAFPSGHATLGHMVALLLLQIEPLYQRYGLFSTADPDGKQVGEHIKYEKDKNALADRDVKPSPLLWLADRVAKNRERLGVHYPSDSSAGRHLAAGLVQSMLDPQAGDIPIKCPTLNSVLRKARAEWTSPLDK